VFNIVRSAALLLGLFGLGSSSVSSPLAWAPGNPLPTPCSAQAAVEDAAGVTFFLLGGNCPANPLIGFYSSTAFPAAWSDLVIPLDTSRIGAGAAINPSVVEEELVYGGAEAGGSSLNTAGTGFLYDPNSDFLPVASMSVARSYHGYASVAGRAYAIGGIDDAGNVLASVESFGATGIWQKAAPLPVALWAFPAVADGAGHIYVFGGATAPGAASVSDALYEYTAATNSWATLAPLPVATRDSAAALGPDGNFYVVGGSSGSAALATVQVYNPTSNTWSLGVSLPVAVRSAAAVVDAQGHLLVLGGVDQTGKIVATTWATQALGQPDVAPSFTSTPTTTGNSSVLYSYQASATGNPQPTLALVAGPAGMTFNPVNGLLNWTPTVTQSGPFTVTLSATNRAGTVNQTFVITVQGPPPTAPTGLVQTGAKADETATVKWKASTVPGGAPIYYKLTQVFCRSGRGGGCSTVVYADHVTGTTAVMTGLKPGSSYLPTVSAVANGHVVAGASATVVTKAIPIPLNVKISKVTQTSGELTWSIPAGTSAAGFVVIAVNGIGAPTIDVKVGNVRSYAFTGLVPNTVYNAYVYAFDAAGIQGSFSAVVSWQTLSPPLVSVTPGQAEAVIGQSLVVLQAPTSTSGNPLVLYSSSLPAPTYHLESGPAGIVVGATTGDVTWSPVSGKAGKYTIVIKATNSQGSTAVSIPVTVYPAGTDIYAPTAITAFPALVSETATTATFSWPAATDNVGVAGYNIYYANSLNGGGQPNFVLFAKSAGRGLQYTLTGLTTGLAQYMAVAAYDAAGNVAALSPAQVVIPK
jgi:hypothetical protein